jgi:hypothetical protein
MAEETAPAGTTNTEAGGDKPATATTSLTNGDKPADQVSVEGANKETDSAKQGADEQADNKDAKAVDALQFSDLKIPDGVVADKALIAEFESVMNDDKLSKKDRAQKLIDFHLKSAGAMATEAAGALEDQKVSWHEEIVNDKELGGGKLQAAMIQARKGFAALTAEAPGLNVARLIDDMTRTGMITHPDLVRAMYWFGQFVGEDNKFVRGGGSGSAPQDMAEAWYGKDGGVKKP